jgi:hypothetical protein
MEAASGINVRVQQEERINGEDEEASGKKESRQGEEVPEKSSQEDGKKTDRQSGAKEKNE